MRQRTRSTITLSGLRAMGRHGVLASERETEQPFVVDAVLEVDTRSAAASDDVADTVDYGVLAHRLADVVTGEPVDLIETLAERLAATCLDDARVSGVRLTVHKPQAPIDLPFGDVAVTVTRRRREEVVLALGSNLGDRLGHLQAAAAALGRLSGPGASQGPGEHGGRGALRASSVWETAPVGGPAQEDYLNAVVVLTPGPGLPDDPFALLAVVQAVELARDRRRDVRWGPRTLDVDVVSTGARLATDRLALPHPRAAVRAFVLLPWLEVEPDAVLPGVGRVADLVRLLPAGQTDGVRRTDLPLLPERLVQSGAHPGSVA